MKRMVLLLGCLLLGGLFLSGCSNQEAPFAEKAYTPEGTVRAIHLDVQDRAVEVVRSQDAQVHIQYAENSKEYYEISVSDDQVLTMTSASDKAWTDYVGGKPSDEDRRIVLQIPEGQLETLTLSTTNEDISVPALSVTGRMELSNNGGNILLENAAVGDTLSLTAKNGDITGTIVGRYEEFAIYTERKKGESNLPEQKTEGEKTLHVSSNNGDIDLSFVEA